VAGGEREEHRSRASGFAYIMGLYVRRGAERVSGKIKCENVDKLIRIGVGGGGREIWAHDNQEILPADFLR